MVLTMARALGKDLVYYFEGDSLFDDSDKDAFDYIKNEMKLKNRKAYLRLKKIEGELIHLIVN